MPNMNARGLRPDQRLAALREGIELMGVEAEVQLASDFEEAVRALTGTRGYSADRGEGVVAAKTVGGIVLINDGAVSKLRPRDLRRLGAHEGGHVRLNQREPGHDRRQGLARSEWHWNLVWVGGYALEEARIERQVARLGFPPADAVEYDHLEYRLYGLCEKAFLSVADTETSVDDMLSAGVTALDRITKTLAYIAAAQIEGTFEFDVSKLSEHAATNWQEFVEPTWDWRLELYSSVPTCADVLTDEEWKRANLEAAELEHETLRSIGFEFRDEGASWGYWNILESSRWQQRLERLTAEADNPTA